MTTEEKLTMSLGEAMFSQRAIRRFKPDPIPDEDLHAALEAATKAPSGSNLQPWRFIVIRDPELKEKFGKLYHEAWWAKRRDQGHLSQGHSAGQGHHSVGQAIGRRDRPSPRHCSRLRYLPGPRFHGLSHTRRAEPAPRRPGPGYRRCSHNPPPGCRRACPTVAQHARRGPGRLLRPPRLPKRPIRPHPTQTPLRSRRLQRLGLGVGSG